MNLQKAAVRFGLDGLFLCEESMRFLSG